MHKWIILLTWASWACGQPVTNKGTDFENYLQRRNIQHFDLLIKNGLVFIGDVPGTGPIQADVLVDTDTIAFIGDVNAALISCTRTIEANGMVVSPGFIDMHAHGNPLQEENFENFLAQGVTSICLGMDGTSPPYDDMEDWFVEVSKRPHGVNVIPFVGHGTIRLITGSGYKHSLETSDIDKMTAYLERSLSQGCFGLSTGLEYSPGYQAEDQELLALAKVVGLHDGLITSHMRNEDDGALAESIKELARQGRHARVNISHFKSVFGQGVQRAQELLVLVDSLRDAGVELTADIYPYTASFTGISILFPDWAKPPHDYQKVSRQRRQELITYLHAKVMSRNGPEATLFGTKPFVGKTLAALAKEKNQPFAEILAEIGPGGASAAYFVMDEALLKTLLKDSLTMICTDGSPEMFHPRGYGSFTKIIEHYVLKDSLLGLSEAIYKMTGLSAKTLRLKQRGALKVGYFADLVVFDPAELQAKATFSVPHTLSEGMQLVVVNGKIAWENQQIISLPGQLLLKG